MCEASARDQTGRLRSEQRIIALDGLRGSLSATVVISHFFGEVEHRVPGLSIGWIAVIVFFTLSGFLVGGIILDRIEHRNFFSVFYIRRATRLLPLFVLWTLTMFAVYALVGDAPWVEEGVAIPLWAYFTFTQNVFMAINNDMGLWWVSQSWSLGIEEHFYLLAPLLIFIVPRAWLVMALCTCVFSAVAWRMMVFTSGWNDLWAQVTVFGRADALALGILIAVLHRHQGPLPWPRIVLAARILPTVMLPIAGVLLAIDIANQHWFWFQVFGPLAVALGSAGFILAIARGAPEGERFKHPVLQFFGSISYAVFLSHLGVAAMLHGFLLGTKPDLGSVMQWGVTLAAIPVVILVGWVLSRYVQDPFMAYGRRWAWSADRRDAAAPARFTPAVHA